MLTIYGKDGCSSCDDAVKLCELNKIKHVYVSLGKDYTIQDFYGIAPRSHKSFPMISFNGEFVGGLKELKEYISSIT